MIYILFVDIMIWYMQKAGLLENHTIDGYDGFTFLRDGGLLLNSTRLDMLIHRIVYEYNAIKIADVIKEEAESELLPNISAHILRHTACTRMGEQGMDQRTLQEIMGHQNLALTMRVYNYVDDKRMRDEMDKIDARRNEDKNIAVRVSQTLEFLHKILHRKKISLHSFTEKMRKHMPLFQPF